MEKVIKNETCRQCSISFDITNKDLEFYEKVSPVFKGEKYLIPSPSTCPNCRYQNMLCFRNERKFYRRKCSQSGVDMISLYSPDKDMTVYEQNIWWGDSWDAIDYGLDIDISKSFFDRLGELIRKTPRINVMNWQSHNSEYTNQAINNKNCYLLTSSGMSEDCMYGHWCIANTFCTDILQVENSHFCHSCVNVTNGYKSDHLQDCIDCSDSSYLIDCIGCKDALACVGLRDKKNYFLNKELSEEEFNSTLIKFKNDPKFKKESLESFNQLSLNTPRKSYIGHNNNNFSGDYILNSKNTITSFNCRSTEDIKYCHDILESKDSMDNVETYQVDASYQYHGGNRCYKSHFSQHCDDSQNIMYSQFCNHSSFLFGCFGLKHKKYCILNKQYTKEQYEELVPKIIEKMKQDGEWGEFFPSLLSPFGYNESIAQEYFPLSKQEALEKGFNWSDYQAPFPRAEKIIRADKLPDNISEVPDDILALAIECEVTKKPFRIIKQELNFYRKHNLPIPKRHPDQRHLDRMNLRNPRKLYNRNCDKCEKEIETTYNPERKKIVYCEECYNKTIY